VWIVRQQQELRDWAERLAAAGEAGGAPWGACVRSYEDRGARGGLLYVSSLSAEIATLAGSTHHSFRRFRRVLRGRRAQDTALAADDANGRRRVETRRFDGVGSRCAALLPGVWQGCYMGSESEVGQAESGFECAQEGVGGGGAVEAVVGLAVAGDDEEGDASGPFQCPSGRFRLRGADQLLAYMDASANSFPSRAAPTSCPRRTSRGRPVGGTARQVGRRDPAQVAVDDQDGQHAGWERLDWGWAGQHRNSGPVAPGWHNDPSIRCLPSARGRTSRRRRS
jgi:hypothetical protein